MKTLKLTLFDILQLESELNGFKNPQTQEVIYKGFINHNLSILLKYDLMDLSEQLLTEKKKVEQLRDDLIKKYGKFDENGNISIKMYNEESKDNQLTISEEYLEFEKEYNLLLVQEVEIRFPEISREDLKNAGNTTDNYMMLFKLMKENNIQE
jgi:hypothetical protein